MSRRLPAILTVLIGLLILAAPGLRPAQAQSSGFILDAENAIDEYGGLSVKFSQVRGLIDTCQGDDPVVCADAISSNPEVQDDLDLPSELPMMFAIYIDIEHRDYWGLVEDAGETVACAAAQIITGGVDVCGLLEDIADAAKEVLSDAEAVVAFLKDLGEDIDDALKDIGCYFGLGGCDTSAPPPATPGQLAAGFYASQLSNGLSKREQSPAIWQSFTVSGSEGVPDVFLLANGKVPKSALQSALPNFISQVLGQWDADITNKYLPTTRGFEKTYALPATVAQYINQGLAKGHSVDLTQANLSYSNGLHAFVAPGQNACSAAYTSSNAALVHDWWAAGRPAAIGLPPIPDPNATCPAFNQAVIQGLNAALRGPLFASLGGACPVTGTGAKTYGCVNTSVAYRCNQVTSLLNGGEQCYSVNGKGKMPYNCHGVVQIYTIGTQPSYCSPAKLGQPSSPGPNGQVVR